MIAAAAGAALGFAAGSVPFAWIIHSIATGRDLRDEGSGNPGATNLGRSAGLALALAAVVLDVGKGTASVLAAGRVLGSDATLPAAMGSVIGHVFSPWLGGRGGKGVATTAGAFAAIVPLPTFIATMVFAVVLAITRFVSLAAVTAAAALPVAVSLTGGSAKDALGAAAIAMLIAWRHRENFARMRRRTEPRLLERAPLGGRPPE